MHEIHILVCYLSLRYSPRREALRLRRLPLRLQLWVIDHDDVAGHLVLVELAEHVVVSRSAGAVAEYRENVVGCKRALMSMPL